MQLRARAIPLVVAAQLALACADDYVSSRPPYLAASADVLDFGEVPVGDAEQRALFLINKGDLPMRLMQPESAVGGVFLVAFVSTRDGQRRIWLKSLADGTEVDRVVLPDRGRLESADLLLGLARELEGAPPLARLVRVDALGARDQRSDVFRRVARE